MTSSTTVVLKSNISVSLTLTKRATMRNIDEVNKFVRREAHWSTSTKGLRMLLDLDAVFALVRDDQNNVCGTGILLRTAANMYWIGYMVVAVSYRRCGMGHAIMTALIEQFRSRR